jgi:hypothetical protein
LKCIRKLGFGISDQQLEQPGTLTVHE